ncbi:methyltransferase-domain-containing protein [Gaertneriomyces semiglobifer]|nr:methyltransferase-domain-containing protein [Gaertneriomyces semiglobifer]
MVKRKANSSIGAATSSSGQASTSTSIKRPRHEPEVPIINSNKTDKAALPLVNNDKKRRIDKQKHDKIRKLRMVLSKTTTSAHAKPVATTAADAPTPTKSAKRAAGHPQKGQDGRPPTSTVQPEASHVPTPSKTKIARPPPHQPSPQPTLSTLQQKMSQKLAGSKFRWINEILYTKPSEDAVRIFQETPEYFQIYHEGFRSQTRGWSLNPVDKIIDEIQETLARASGKKGNNKGGKQSGNGDLVIADLGCGDAKVGQTLAMTANVKVHSFDLVSTSPFVTACDIANTPLPSESVDISIFSLSLMGVNYMDFIREAYRITKRGGTMKVAEVKSRFPDVEGFLVELQSVGWRVVKRDDGNKMFILFDFVKVEPATDSAADSNTNKPGKKGGEPKQGLKKSDAGAKKAGKKVVVPAKSEPASKGATLKPCIYKRR